MKTLKNLLLAGIVSGSAAPGADITWDGTTGPFGSGTNWDGDAVPGSGDIAHILNGGTAQIASPDSFTLQRLVLGGFSGTGSLEISGGTLALTLGGHNAYIGGNDSNGGTGSGILNISGGSLVASGGEFLVGSRGGTGTVNMTGGTLSNTNWIIFGRDGGGTGNANLSGDAQINKTGGGNFVLGVFSGTTNTATLSDSASITSNTEIRLGWGNNSAATKGVLNLNDNSSASAGGNFQVGFREPGGSAGPSGELHLTGSASASSGNEFYIGHGAGASGILTMEGASTVNVNTGFVVGRFNATGTVTLNDSAQINVGGFTVLGDLASAVANVTVNGNASINTTEMVWIGHSSSTASLTVNGGLVTSHANLGADNTGAGIAFRGTSTLNLNGGTVETPGFNKTGPVAELNLNGGVIRATGNTNTGSYFNNFASGDIDIQAGGAIIDTNGNDITVVQDLAGDGGLTKQGTGSLVLGGSSTYGGSTVISGGSLVLGASDRIGDTSMLTLDGGTLDLNNFSEALAALTLGLTSTIDFGAIPGANALSFADSSSIAWTGSLILENFEVGLDTLNFSSESGLTPEQLDAITLDGYYATGLTSGGDVIFAVIPEPAGVGLAITGMLFLLTAFRRRQAA